jgi:hypothetical protein
MSSVDIKSGYESILSNVNDIGAIQALLESKQRELSSIMKTLDHTSDRKIQYQLESCGNPSKEKSSILFDAILKAKTQIKEYELAVAKLKIDVLQLQNKLEKIIPKAHKEKDITSESMSEGSES